MLFFFFLISMEKMQETEMKIRANNKVLWKSVAEGWSCDHQLFNTKMSRTRADLWVELGERMEQKNANLTK